MDKYYEYELMDCGDSIFPYIREISEGKWRQLYVKGWEEYDP